MNPKLSIGAGRGLRLALAVAASLLVAGAAPAVVLDSMNRVSVKLKDGTDVVLYGEYVSKITGRDADIPEYDPVPLSKRRHFDSPAAVTTRAGDKNKGKGKGEDEEKPLSAQQQDVEDFRTQQAADREKFDQLRKDNQAPGFAEHVMSKRYYYIPPGNSLHLSQRPDGVPEFLFVKYTSEEADGAQGGLFHFLMEWSLTPEQEQELRAALEKQIKGAELVGAAPIEEDTEGGAFRIISAVLTDEGMTRSLVQSGHAPTMPGGKVAAAANLSADGAQLFLATVEESRSVADLSVELSYGVTLMTPGAKGEIIFHWDRLQEFSQKEVETYEETKVGTDTDIKGGCVVIWCAFTFESQDQVAIEQNELSQMFDSLVENEVVELKFEGYDPDAEYTATIIEAMLQYFTNSLLDPADPIDYESFRADEQPQEGEDGKPKAADEDDQVVAYTINREKMASAFQSKEQRVRLDFGLAVRKPFQLVGNLASWYDSVRDNQNCVIAVNLNDPFFRHREMRFILDLDATEIFDEMVNYVTVNVRKRRSKGHDFNESITIDKAYLEEKGIAASLTYARMEDKDNETYEYMTQWSLKGGNLFPAKGRWQKGQWEGVTLAPPIERWNIEVEGDIDQMEASDIARVTVEMHYPTFGKEQFKVVPLSPRGGQYLVEDQIYVDRGTRGFAYRLIVHHKTEGRMVLPWQTRIGDRYVYAQIPEEILVAGDLREEAKLAAKKMGRMGTEKVLDKFQELFASAD